MDLASIILQENAGLLRPLRLEKIHEKTALIQQCRLGVPYPEIIHACDIFALLLQMLYNAKRIQSFDRNLHMYMPAAFSTADAPKRYLLLRTQSDEILIQLIHQTSSSSIFLRQI